MTDEVAKAAGKLNLQQVRTMTWWSKSGSIQCDVPKGTQNALVKRGLAEWPPGEDLCAKLTPFGLEVQAYLLVKAQAEEDAKTQALRDQNALREEGKRDGQVACALDLYRAVYDNDSWPDRPLDTIWEHLIEQVRKQFQAEEAV